MKHTLKGEVLTPLMVIHGGVILLISTIILRIPYEPAVGAALILAAILSVGGSIALWRFVVTEMVSIKKCHEAIITGNLEEYHSDRDDELGELEEDIVAFKMKHAS